jgi:hydroxylaminobenzene mutase
MHRRLIWHGFLLFVVSLLVGLVVPSFANPRMGLSAHVGGLMSGLFLIALGAVWGALTLTPGRAAAIYWLALYGMWIGTAALVLAALFGTGSLTPIAGAGRAGAPWQEAIVVLMLVPSAIAAVACCVLVLLALREPVD